MKPRKIITARFLHRQLWANTQLSGIYIDKHEQLQKCSDFSILKMSICLYYYCWALMSVFISILLLRWLFFYLECCLPALWESILVVLRLRRPTFTYIRTTLLYRLVSTQLRSLRLSYENCTLRKIMFVSLCESEFPQLGYNGWIMESFKRMSNPKSI